MKLNYYSKRLYYKSETDETSYGAEVWERIEKLRYFAQLKAEGCSHETALKVLGLSKSRYYRWKKTYQKQGLAGLEKQSKRPDRVRTPSWSNELALLVLKLRKNNPMWGKAKIHAVLKRDYQIKSSESTIGRIISKYIKQGKIQPVDFYFKRKFKRARSFNNHAQRWQRGMKAKIPGELLQIDHMSLSPMSDVSIKHFKAVCPVTKITTEQAYGSATSVVATQFLDHVIQTLPFPVHSIQVDGGSEFMGEFEEKCKSLGIPLYVLPPRSPEYNGNVERGNSTVKYEFYAHYLGSFKLPLLRFNLQKYVQSYNSYRPHQALQNLTPLQYYQKISGGSLSHIY
jgi:transposase InsO family protein